MAIGQAQFDADLAAAIAQVQTENTNVAALIAAIQAFLANPQVIDLTNEDTTVNALAATMVAQAATVTAEIALIPVPPGGPAKPAVTPAKAAVTPAKATPAK